MRRPRTPGPRGAAERRARRGQGVLARVTQCPGSQAAETPGQRPPPGRDIVLPSRAGPRLRFPCAPRMQSGRGVPSQGQAPGARTGSAARRCHRRRGSRDRAGRAARSPSRAGVLLFCSLEVRGPRRKRVPCPAHSVAV